jgi:hypothetical protein
MTMENVIVEWKDNNIHYEVWVRNVADKNPKHQIQIIIQRYNIIKKRKKAIVCLDIPKEKVDDFIKGVLTDEQWEIFKED